MIRAIFMVCAAALVVAVWVYLWLDLRKAEEPKLDAPMPGHRGISDSHCNYYSSESSFCNKCGRIHDGGEPPYLREVPFVKAAEKKVVFVPFEIPEQGEPIKRNDLPRFTDTKLITEFFQEHPEIHTRNGNRVHLQWIEHAEDWAQDEYDQGVGQVRD